MKLIKSTILITAILLTVFCACKKEKQTEVSIVGKWKLRSYVITNFDNTGRDQDDSKGDDPRPTFNFDNHGIFTSTLEGMDNILVTEYVLERDTVRFKKDIAFDHFDFKFNITGSVLTLKRTDTRTTQNNISYVENTTITLDKY